MLKGGCFCNRIRYRITAIFDAFYCHCPECRKTSGNPMLATAIARSADFEIIEGEPRKFRRSNGFHYFCEVCGSHLFYQSDAKTYVSVPIGSLDMPEQVQPLAHQFWPQKLRWLALADDLPKFEANQLSHPDQRRR